MTNKYLEKIASTRFVREMVGQGAAAVTKGLTRAGGKAGGAVGHKPLPASTENAAQAFAGNRRRSNALAEMKQHGPVEKYNVTGAGTSAAHYKERMKDSMGDRIKFPDAKK